MNRQQQVLAVLKLKAKALGFNVKELKGIAAKIADNLGLSEEASDDEVNMEIEKQVDMVLPFLSFGQSQANRLLEEWKKNHPDHDDDDDDNEPSASQGSQNGKKIKNSKNNSSSNDEEPAWFKLYREQQDMRFAALESEKTLNLRKAKLESLLKDSGSFGVRTLKSFAKMKFDNDDDFDEFYAGVEDDLKSYNQERADAGLSTLGNPPAAGGGKAKENEVLTDDEIKALARF